MIAMTDNQAQHHYSIRAFDEFLTTLGAAGFLGVTKGWVQKLARQGRLPAYVFNEQGHPERYSPGVARQGQGLYFHVGDLRAYKPSPRGRPLALKDKHH